MAFSNLFRTHLYLFEVVQMLRIRQRSRGWLVLAPLVAIASLTSQLEAQVDSALFKGLRYRMVGPNRGGRSTAVTGQNIRRLAMGSSQGQQRARASPPSS